MPDSHALLSASSASRWIACPPSSRIAAQFPDKESEAAIEGTMAHEEAEKWFKDGIKPKDPYVWQYISFVTTSKNAVENSTLLIEERVDFSHIAPRGFGTADCIIHNKDLLHVIDFKYGKGVLVEAQDNPQMILYALGAIHKLNIIPKEIKMTIVQPRINNISTWAIQAKELHKKVPHIKKQAKLAWQGKGEFEAGEHCRFCPFKNICTEFKSYFNSQYLITF